VVRTALPQLAAFLLLTSAPLNVTAQESFADAYADSIRAVAGWIYDEFWSGQNRHSPASLEERLKEAQDVGAIPLSLLALCGQTPVGTVNLIENDDERRAHLRPWLAALLVLPRYRRQGIGSLLIRSLQEQAGRIGEREMFLGTDNPDFYLRREVTVVERLDSGFCILRLATHL